MSFTPFSLRSIPVVRGILIAAGVVFLLSFFLGDAGRRLVESLAFKAVPGTLIWLLRPWSLLTYPLVNDNPISLLFWSYGLYMIGGSLERSWGWRNFAVIFAALVAITAVVLIPISYLFNVPVGVAGYWIPVTSLLVAWAAMDPQERIHVYGILPVPIWIVALADVLILYFLTGQGYGPMGPIIALFFLAGPAAAWFYVRKMPRLNIGFQPARTVRSGPRRREPLLREPLLREQPPRERGPREQMPASRPTSRREQEEIERLKKLLGEDDDRPKSRRY